MIKKCAFFYLALALFFAIATASAEASQSASTAGDLPAEFSYRDGVKFGMTVAQVKELEKNKPAEEHWQTNYSMSDTYYVEYQGEKTLDFTCDIKYHFTGSDGELFQIEVSVYTSFARDFDYSNLQDEYSEIDYALTKKYGAPDEPATIEPILGTSYMKQFTIWSGSDTRNVAIQHSLLSGGVDLLHSIYYNYFDPGTPGSI